MNENDAGMQCIRTCEYESAECWCPLQAIATTLHLLMLQDRHPFAREQHVAILRACISTQEEARFLTMAEVLDVTAYPGEGSPTDANLDAVEPRLRLNGMFSTAKVDDRPKPWNQVASRKRVSHLSRACFGVSGSIGQEKLKLNCRHVSPRTSCGLLLRGAWPSRLTTAMSIQNKGRWSGQPSNFASPLAGLGFQGDGIPSIGSSTCSGCPSSGVTSLASPNASASSSKICLRVSASTTS